jgi:histidyl-tRNA synthetase
VFDILPQEPQPEDGWRHSDHWQYIESVMRKCAADYGFKEIRTPIFERTELFVRGVGEGSDIVSKEMYTFLDKAERSMTLRPEGTASVIRAFVEKNLAQQPGLHKFFYIGPMFRYERPQAGRYRQHHQFGAEAIGIGKPEQDVEMIDMLYEIYHRLGLKNLSVMINSVGDEASRAPFRKALGDYLFPFLEDLSEDSKVRFSKNILRILDSKDARDQEILKNAPILEDYLSEASKEHFATVKALLFQMKIPYVVNPKLVRGLDYYNKTVFEVVSHELGAHNTIGGGGRYDGLTALFGGPDLPACGFATGLERLLQTMVGQKVSFP